MRKKSFFIKLANSIFFSAVLSVIVISLIQGGQLLNYMHKRVDNDLEEELHVVGQVVDNQVDRFNNVLNYLGNNSELQNILMTDEYDSYDERFADIQRIYVIVNSIEIKTLDIPIYIMSMNNPMLRYSNQENFLSIYGDKNGYGFQKIIEVANNSNDQGYYVHKRVDGLENKETVMTIVRRVRHAISDEVVGYVFMDIYDEFFNEIFHLKTEEAGIQIYVTDREYTIITDNHMKTETGYTLSQRDLFDDNLEEESLRYDRDLMYKYKLPKSNLIMFKYIDTTTVYEYRKIIVATTFFSIILTLFLSVLMSYFVSKKMSKPITDLSNKMKAVEGGDFDTRIEIHTGDEIEDLGSSFNSMIESTQNLIDQVYKKQVLLQETENKLLKSKMNPHFINNTLESIKWLIKGNENDRAAKMIASLGKLISKNMFDDDVISIRQELEFIERYVELQRMRFEDKLNMKYFIDQSLLDYKIPNFVIQPLVENSIIHGIETLDQDGIIILNIYKEHDMIVIQVIDNGDGDVDANSGNGIALKNIQQRLPIYYDEQSSFKLYKKYSLTIAEIRVPMLIERNQ